MGPRSFERGEAERPAELEQRYIASMGPRSFERGEFGLSEGISAAPRRFNGATFIRTWRDATSDATPRQVLSRLQWGHVHSNVESLGQVPIFEQLLEASMGPRSFERGEPDS